MASKFSTQGVKQQAAKKGGKSGAKKQENVRIVTPPFRVSFPNVFKPKSNFEGQEPVYSVQMLFPKGTDLSKMEGAAHKAAVKKWGSDENDWPNFKHPTFKDGNEKNLEDYKNMTVVEARTKLKPGIVDRDKNEILDASEFYAGCWARATLTCYAYTTKGNSGVSFGLSNLQKIKDDKAFSGRKNAKDDFDEIEDLDDEEIGSDDAGEDFDGANEDDF